MFKCDFCNKTIKPNQKIFKGFDCTFCSENCRLKIGMLNKMYDDKLCYYELWYKKTPNKIIINNKINHNESIINLQKKNIDSKVYKLIKIYKLLKNKLSITKFTLIIISILYIYY